MTYGPWDDEIDESFRRHIRRNLEDDSDDAMRVRPVRSIEEVQVYHQRVAGWIQALIAQHTTPWSDGDDILEASDRMDKETRAMPVKAKRLMDRLFLQMDVLSWVLNTDPDDLVEETRDRVADAGVDMYELEDKWQGEDA